MPDFNFNQTRLEERIREFEEAYGRKPTLHDLYCRDFTGTWVVHKKKGTAVAPLRSLKPGVKKR